MKNTKKLNRHHAALGLMGLMVCSVSTVKAGVGNLIWEDNFNNLNTNIWNIDVGDGCDQGLCGWGNQELQWYAENNISVQDIPGEAGNKGLVLEARNETISGKAFTSGKVQSSNKLAVQYGMIEIRMQVSNIETGLWPALWMLGTSTADWPSKGEIDMMEMGQSAAARADAGFPNAASNNYTGSNLIFYTDAACSEANPGCAASVAYQNDNAHLSATPLTNRFVTYRTYWTDTEIRFTVEDNGVEYDMYDAPFMIDEESNEFQAPFYLLMNLAVGGNFTDALTNNQVTAPLPAKMIVDYVRVYELDGQGQVFSGNLTQPETGTFGVYTDNTPTHNSLEPGVSSDIYVWNQNSVSPGTLAPFEGSNVIAWHYTPNEWFGGGIQTRQARDMSNFINGDLKFKIKIPANVAFRIGIADTYTNENWITFPANTTNYGLVRNGEWAEATIPVTDLVGGLIALQSIKNHFNIVSVAGEEPTFSFDLAIDDVVWAGGGASSDNDNDGIDDSIDQCLNTPANANVDNLGCEIVDEIELTDLAGIVSAQFADADSPPAERMANTFDSSIDTKYLVFNASAWIQFKIDDAAYVANKYRLTSANDAPQRDPLNWSLQGSNDGNNWTTLDSRANEDFTTRKQTREFTFSNNAAFQYYRLNMSNNSGTILQLAELEILGLSTPINIDGDSDGDGVLDSVDICANTPNGTAVDSVGCAIPLDSDNDGVTDNIDQCANTPAGTAVDANGCTLVMSPEGLEQISDSSVTFYVNSTGWADVHYSLNGGGQQNLRMLVANGRNEFTVSGLTSGDVITYFFTYLQDNGSVIDSATQSHTISGDGTNNSSGPEGYTLCASENTTCSFSGAASVAYGANDAFNYQNATNSIACNNSTFGDPISGVAKSCYYQSIQVVDSDNDGVNDDVDQCPNTPAGTAVNTEGCALLVTQNVVIQAEDYDAFFDTDTGNTGGVYRADDVDIEATTDDNGGYNVGWTQAGEWLDYNVILGTGTYNVSTRVASDTGGGSYALTLYGNEFNTDNVANTGGWQSFETHNLGQVTVTAEGAHILRLTTNTSGYNINWLKLDLVVAGSNDSDNDGVNNSIDQCPNTPVGEAVNSLGCPIIASAVTPLFDGSTLLEGTHQEHTATALITRYGDRPRTRHAKENEFQSYDHYIAHYFERRSSSMEIIDRVAKGGQGITLNVRTVWPISSQREGRVWYMGWGTVADYIDNSLLQVDRSRGDAEGFDGTHYHYTKEINVNPRNSLTNNSTPGGTALGMHGDSPAIQIGDLMEFEISQFSGTRNGEIIGGQTNYYGSTFLYIVGKGIVPWYTENTGEMVNSTRHQVHYQEDSRELPEEYRLGGHTTVPYQYTHEPDNYFMQMALNIDYDKSQKFLDGRRVFHSSFANGQHDEFVDNGTFTDVTNLIADHHVNESCSGCHERNGGAAVEANGVPLDRWVFKIGDATGAPDANRGRVLQPSNINGNSEGNVSISQWTEIGDGLRIPTFNFSSGQPATFSPRIAPRLVGLGLLEAIKEQDILALEQTQQNNNDGVSGRANIITDPTNPGLSRIGRFGWKASTVSVEHQVAAALNTDMGVKTSMLPDLDCGSNQSNCNSGAPPLDDTNLDKLVYYVQALAVRAQRGLESGVENQAIKAGKQVFMDTGCAACHTPSFQTSEFHPLVEVRDQTIQPYTDLLVHDMGDGLADNLGEGLANGREWRTTPLWGLGLSMCVTNGVINPQGGEGNEVCNTAPGGTYLHDGRARTIREAILWHGTNGSEAMNSTNNYKGLSATDLNNLHQFLEAL